MADPMYRVIADDLRRRIGDGELAPGAQLQTELELREMYQASRNTIRDAIKWLVSLGLVETRPGQGTFVVQKMEPFVTTLTGTPEVSSGEGTAYQDEVAAAFRRPDATPPRVEIQKAENLVPELGVQGDDQVVSRHQRRSIDGIPWSLQTSFYPMDLVLKGATRLIQAGDIREGTVAYLKATLNVTQVGYRDTLMVRAPDDEESRFFQLAADGRVSVIELRRTAYDGHGAPIRLTVSVYPADRNQFAVNVGLVPGGIAAPPDAVLAEPVAAREPAAGDGQAPVNAERSG
jgi:GntR family transcriptional regulator